MLNLKARAELSLRRTMITFFTGAVRSVKETLNSQFVENCKGVIQRLTLQEHKMVWNRTTHLWCVSSGYSPLAGSSLCLFGACAWTGCAFSFGGVGRLQSCLSTPPVLLCGLCTSLRTHKAASHSADFQAHFLIRAWFHKGPGIR